MFVFKVDTSSVNLQTFRLSLYEYIVLCIYMHIHIIYTHFNVAYACVHAVCEHVHMHTFNIYTHILILHIIMYILVVVLMEDFGTLFVMLMNWLRRNDFFPRYSYIFIGNARNPSRCSSERGRGWVVQLVIEVLQATIILGRIRGV